MGLSIDGWMVAWNPANKEGIEVGPWPDQTGWSAPSSEGTHPERDYCFTSGCCHLARHEMTLEPKVMMMFIDFHTCVVRDGIDLFAAHAEFLKIDEYRQRTQAHRQITVRRIHHHDASNAVVELAVETRRPLQPII
jgi:hypothetical protein